MSYFWASCFWTLRATDRQRIFRNRKSATGIDKKLCFATFCYMSTVIRISENLAHQARTRSSVEHRSMTAQVEYWASIGKIAEENPDLPFAFIKEILLGMEELKEKAREEYVFG